MSIPATKQQKLLFSHWILPAVALAAMMLFDYYFLNGATVTPVCSFLILALLAFILPPVPMIFWACAYACGAMYIVFHPEIFRPGAPDYALMHIIHAIGLVIGSSFSVLLCFHHLKGIRKSEQLNLLVREIPIPFVLSDCNGEIVFMNTQAAQLLGVGDKKTEGDSYFTLLTDTSQKGNAIQKYLELFDAATFREMVIELKPKNNPGAVLRGTLMQADGDNDRYLITIISEPVLSVC
jgi:PAS domain-containing protein